MIKLTLFDLVWTSAAIPIAIFVSPQAGLAFLVGSIFAILVL